MGGNVLLPYIHIRSFVYPVFVITQDGAPVSVFAVIIPCRISVINRKDKASLQRLIDLPQPILNPQVDLCCVSFLKLYREISEIMRKLIAAQISCPLNKAVFIIDIKIYFL